VSDDVSDAMRAVAQLAAEFFTPDRHDEHGPHIIDHFNGHRILKRLIYNDTERMKTRRKLVSLAHSSFNNNNNNGFVYHL